MLQAKSAPRARHEWRNRTRASYLHVGYSAEELDAREQRFVQQLGGNVTRLRAAEFYVVTYLLGPQATPSGRLAPAPGGRNGEEADDESSGTVALRLLHQLIGPGAWQHEESESGGAMLAWLLVLVAAGAGLARGAARDCCATTSGAMWHPACGDSGSRRRRLGRTLFR